MFSKIHKYLVVNKGLRRGQGVCMYVNMYVLANHIRSSIKNNLSKSNLSISSNLQKFTEIFTVITSCVFYPYHNISIIPYLLLLMYAK